MVMFVERELDQTDVQKNSDLLTNKSATSLSGPSRHRQRNNRVKSIEENAYMLKQLVASVPEASVTNGLQDVP